MCALATFIYSYIHTSCGVLWSTLSQTRASCVVTKRVIAYCCSTQCVWDGGRPLSSLFCPGQKSYFETSLQVDRLSNQSAHSCRAGVTREQKCFASHGGKKTCCCGITEYLNIKSVLYRQTHNAEWMFCNFSLADVGKTVSVETLDSIATECCWMNVMSRVSCVAATYSFEPRSALSLSSLHNCS